MDIKTEYKKAYILGLMVGGGIINNNTFEIDLPLNKWGMNPNNMNKIANDILKKISEWFLECYGFNVTYSIQKKDWVIIPSEKIDITNIIDDLLFLHLPTKGIIMKTTDLSYVKSLLKDNFRDHFLTGIFDAKASLTKSHRRFSAEAPIVSIEIPGSINNFYFVVQLCSWLTELGSVTDQILFNHPCQHSPSDPDYKGWNKGFKIRLLIKSFIYTHSFAMSSKAFDAKKLKENQNVTEQDHCENRNPRNINAISIHNDINCDSLPECVKNKMFFHYHHFCAVLGCKFAPKNKIQNFVDNYKNLLIFFPKLSKGTISEILFLFSKIKKQHFPYCKESNDAFSVRTILSNTNITDNYDNIKSGIAYLFSPKLNGKRHEGKQDDIIDNNLDSEILIYKIDDSLNAPMVIVNSKLDRAALISSANNAINQKNIEDHVKIDGLKVIVNE